MLHEEFNKNSFFLFYDTLDNLLDQSSVWYPTALEKIQEEFPELAHARLLSIFILSEQTDIDLIFGLEFGLREDSEHGRGLKFSLNSLEILEYGIGEVAYYQVQSITREALEDGAGHGWERWDYHKGWPDHPKQW